MPQVTKQMAERIAGKLRAKQAGKSGAHMNMAIYHGDVLVANFGIRHGSNKDQGHDHVQGAIHVSAHFARELGTCTKSQQQWVDLMIEKGVIAPPPAETPE